MNCTQIKGGSIMNYFKYQYSGSLGQIWGLFSELSNLSKSEVLNANKRCDFSHTVDIISSAMNGGLSCEDFNLRAYEYSCKRTDDIKQSDKRKKELVIVDTVNGDEDTPVGYGEISSNDIRLRVIDEAIEMLEADDEFERCLAELYNIREDYIVEKGVDVVEMLSNSLKGIPEAVSFIRGIVLEDTKIKELVESLCENGIDRLQGRLIAYQ